MKQKQQKKMRGLGVGVLKEKVYLFAHDENCAQNVFVVRKSTDGVKFQTISTNAQIISLKLNSDNLADCSNFHLSKSGELGGGFYYLTYLVDGKVVVKYENYSKKLCVAKSRNLVDWEKISEQDCDGDGKIVVRQSVKAGEIDKTEKTGKADKVSKASGVDDDVKIEKLEKLGKSDKYLMYCGGVQLNLQTSSDAEIWRKQMIAPKINGSSVRKTVQIADVRIAKEGIWVIYYVQFDNKGKIEYHLFNALFDIDEPTRVLWFAKKPIFISNGDSIQNAQFFGLAILADGFISYWQGCDGLFLLRHKLDEDSSLVEKCVNDCAIEAAQEEQLPTISMSPVVRASHNPIMSPREDCHWDSFAAYNPTTIKIDDTIHIIYRADGDNLMSVWGHASTLDGVTIKSRSKDCIYQRKNKSVKVGAPLPTVYTSGGNSNGGCEDPRATLIDDTIYVTFTAFDGWDSVRVALTSISVDDFRAQNWNWKEATLISPPGEMNKNWAIFPEKIGGKFAIVHSFYPNILVDYFDSLDELDGETFIESNNTRPIDHSRTWDSWFRGIGPAPLRTDDGWLVFYHAMDHRNPDKYQLGAMLLDLDDPTKVLHRTDQPILVPEEHYENNGHKWGVIYSCGAIIKDEQIFIYYGGSDKFVCVATAPLDRFLQNLKRVGVVKIDFD